jgi:hypothetical protein
LMSAFTFSTQQREDTLLDQGRIAISRFGC